MAETVTQLLQERADDDNLAITYEGSRWTWREYIRDAEKTAAAVLSVADATRPMHIGTLLGNTPPDMLIALAAGALGGYVTAGINNTRRGEGLAADILRADCQILITDAEHRPPLLEGGLDLSGVTVLDTSTTQWADLIAGAGELTPAFGTGGGHGHLHADLHLGHQRQPQACSVRALDDPVRRTGPRGQVRHRARRRLLPLDATFPQCRTDGRVLCRTVRWRRDRPRRSSPRRPSSRTSGATRRRT